MQGGLGNTGDADVRFFYDKIKSYVLKVSGPAKQLDPSYDARTFPPFLAAEEDSVFCYVDTASSRAGISALAARLAIPPE